MDNSRIVVPTPRDSDDSSTRNRHIIPTPRQHGMFGGWGVRF